MSARILLMVLLCWASIGQALHAQTVLMTNGSYTGCSGTFYDSGSSFGNYLNGESYQYTICATAGSCVRVQFTSFDLESGYDFLEVYDGPNTFGTFLGSYTGTVGPGTVVSTTGCLTFVFSSDFIISAPGWTANISCAPCGGGGGSPTCLPNMGNCVDSVCSGVFRDPGGTGNYSNSQNFVHTLCSNNGGCINVNFSSFDLEWFSDFVNIYDGPSVFSPSIGSYTGNTLPPSISASNGCLTFEFFSDFSTVGTGWEANLSCSPCPSATSADCAGALQVCTSTTTFPVFANGQGAIADIPPFGSVGNPSTNPASFNSGCLLADERNSTWLIFRIATPGNLEFHFGTPANPQAGFYDWAMWNFTNNGCGDIPANLLSPVRCNWNCLSSGGTGIADPSSQPFGSSACNYEPPLPVVVNQIFAICFSNYSNINSTVGFTFETQAGNALVDCSPILAADDVYLMGEALPGYHDLQWAVLHEDGVLRYTIEQADGAGWRLLGSQDVADAGNTHHHRQAMPGGGSARYRIGRVSADGSTRYSNVVELSSPAESILSAHPNPAQHSVRIHASAEGQTSGLLELFDLQGQRLRALRLDAIEDSFQSTLDLSGLPAGVYLLRVGKQSLKLVVE
jgi:CUB domain/Secretion system C-terminal sorting domain